MNFLPGTLRHASGGTVIDLEDGQHWQVSAQEIGAVGQKVWLGLRPEHLQVVDGHGLNAVIRVVEPTGADTHLIMKLGQTELCATVRDRINAQSGQTLQVAPLPGKAYLFDHASEARIALTTQTATPEVVQ
jgi:multiple sugar transport system ATP-binding protein